MKAKIDVKKILYVFVIIVSMLLTLKSPTMLAIWIGGISLVLVSAKGVQGAIEALLFIQIRQLLNAEYAIGMSQVTTVKMVCTILLFVYILIKSLPVLQKKTMEIVLLISIVFGYIVITALVFSSYPVISIAKGFLYAFGFITIICGISATKEVDWISKFLNWFGTLLIGSIVLINSPTAYMVNGHAFQGILNHPNMYGIMLALFLTAYLYKNREKITIMNIIIIAISLFLIFKTESRTSLLSAAVVLIIYFIQLRISVFYKIVVGVAGLFLVYLSLGLPIFDFISDFLYKGNAGDIFYSRRGLIDNNLARFEFNPLFGTGFSVPFEEGVRDLSFSFDQIVENGNLILAILADMGIVGTLLFVLCYGYIFICGNKKGLILFIAPFMVSMGEMVFFSTNNCAIILYMFFAVYLSREVEKETKSRSFINVNAEICS